ncbi:MAG: hypothetical protein ACI8RZ_007367, partial [Myxococcota bacterium]
WRRGYPVSPWSGKARRNKDTNRTQAVRLTQQLTERTPEG